VPHCSESVEHVTSGRKSSSISDNTVCVDGLDSAGSGQNRATDSCEHDFNKKHTILILSKLVKDCFMEIETSTT